MRYPAYRSKTGQVNDYIQHLQGCFVYSMNGKAPPAGIQDNCALCHGKDGQGQKVAGRIVFPPLWGPDSYNWGACMHQLDNAAAFVQANMPLGRGGSLGNQEAWDVAMFIDAHERPQEFRFTGDVAATRKQFHDDPNSLYGTVVDGRLLGANPSGPGARKSRSVHQ